MKIMFEKPIVYRLPRNYTFLYKGYPVVVDKRFFDLHPGSRKALENHIGEDITELWKILHSNTTYTKTLLWSFIYNKKYKF